MSINAQPFSPTFKLVGNLSDSQILVYDASENAFVNATNTGASGSTGLTSVLNTGTGEVLGQATGSALELKSLIAGTNLTITDNGTALVLDATSSTASITGTNLGTGSGVYKQNNNAGDQLEFKSIAVGNGLTLTDANDTLSIECTISTAGFLQATNNLSDIGDATTARTNLDVYSKAEADAKYFRVDQTMAPTVDNTFDLGSSTKRFNDIYAETLQGTAVLSDNLTITGSTGDVLTFNGSTWVASAPTGGGGGGNAGVPQTLTINGATLSISGGNTVTLPNAVDLDPYVRLDQHSVPTQDNMFDIGSSTRRYNDVYAETFQGTAVLSDNLTVAGNTGDVLTYNGSTWVASPPANAGQGGQGVPQTLSLNGTQIAISSGNSIDIGSIVNTNTSIDWANVTNKPTIPADVSDLTDTTSLLGGGSQSLSLSGTQLTLSGGNTVDFSGMFTDTDNQTLTFDTNNNRLTIANGNYVDLSSLAGGGGASNITDLGDVDTSSGGHIPTNGQALVWSQAMGHWMPGDVFDGDYNSLSNQPTIPSNQTLLFSGTNLSISGGNGVDLSSLSGAGAQSLSLAGTQLSISGSNTVDFSGMFTDTDNQTLSFDTSTNILTIANGNTVDLSNLAGSSNVQTIDDLSDVSVTGTSDGQFLVYNNTSGEWENQTVSLSGSIAGSSDTTIANTQQFQSLQWSGTAWVNSYPSIQHLSDIDRLNNPSNGDTLVWNNLNNQYEYSQAVVSDQSLATTDDVTFNRITTTTTVTANAFEGKLYDTNGNVLLDNTSGSAGFGGNISSNGSSSFSGTVDFNGATIQNLDLALGDLSNVSSSTPSTGHVLKWSGTEWAPAADSTATGGSGISLTDLSTGVGLSYNNVTGNFALNASIGDLLDVNTSGIASGQILKWNGSSFVAGDDNVLQSTDNLPEGSSNLYYTDARWEGKWNTKSTDDLPEGATNKYYSDTFVDARLQTQLSAGPGINLVLGGPGAPITIEATGAGSTYTDADARLAMSVSQQNASGSGALSYNNTSGVFTYTPPDLSGFTSFDGAYASLTGKPTIPTNVSDLTNDSGFLTSVGTINYNDLSNKPTIPADLGDLTDTGNLLGNASSIAWSNVTSTPTTLAGYGINDAFSGAYNDLSGKPTEITDINQLADSNSLIPSALGDLTMPTGSNGQVLTTDGSGNFTFTTVSGGGSSYGDSDVQSYMGQFDFHILPDTNATYDIGSASNKIRHLFLSDNSLYIGNNTLNTSGSDLMFNSQDVMDYTNIKNKPTIPTDVDDLTDTGNLLGGTSYTAGSGLQLNTGVFSLDASLGDLDNVSSSAPSSGQVLSWTGSEWAPTAAGGTPNLSSSSVGDLNDVNISGIQAGQFLEWDGTRFIAASADAADLTSESITELQDVSTDAPNNGDVLTWDSTSSAYKPSAPASGGGGGSGTSTERFKLNYATNGSLSSISNATSGVSATILSTTGGTVEITFSGHSYPPANILVYGYARTSNQYVIMPLNKDITTRTVAGGGTPGSPTAFGSLGTSVVTLTLREADTGASRSFGTDTHAWLVFSMM
jgi:hypothetical protein